MRLNEVYGLVVEIALYLNEIPIARHRNCWELDLDDDWWITVNGHRAPKRSTTGHMVAPMSVHVEFNGIPVGCIGLRGGSLGSSDDERAFMTALRRKKIQAQESETAAELFELGSFA